MQKPPNFPSKSPIHFDNWIVEDPQQEPIPHWHKIIVAKRLRNRNKPNNLDMPWEELMQRLIDQHENL